MKKRGYLTLLLSYFVILLLIVSSFILFRRDNQIKKMDDIFVRLFTKIEEEYILKYDRVCSSLSEQSEIKDILRFNKKSLSLYKKIDFLSQLFDLSIIYVMNTKGDVVFSTEYLPGKDLEGNNYYFRPYFQNSLNGKHDIYIAKGITTQERGVYFSYPVYIKENIAGVIVIKKGIKELENIFYETPYPAALTSSHSVVFVSNIEEWVYKSIEPISEEKSKIITESKQFSDVKITELDIQLKKSEAIFMDQNYLYLNKGSEYGFFRIFLFYPLQEKIALSDLQFNIMLFSGFLLLIIVIILTSLIHKIKKRDYLDVMIKKEEILFSDIIANSEEGFLLLDKDFKIMKINKVLTKMLDIESSNIDEKNIFDILKGNVKEDFENLLYKKEDVYKKEIEFNNDGSDKKIICMMNLKIIYKGDQFKGAFVFFTDITELKKTKEEIIEINRDLEKRVLNRTKELSLSVSQLKQTQEELNESYERFKKDEEAGKRLQQQQLPESYKKIDNYQFFNIFIPSMYLSGDFIDYFKIDERYIVFYIADVSGHGTSSAFVTIWLKSFVSEIKKRFFENNDNTIIEPVKFLETLNKSLYKEKFEKHITVFYGVIDQKDDVLRYSNSGHYPFPIVKDDKKYHLLKGKGMPTGLLENSKYELKVFNMPEQFFFIAFSDGILEILPQKTAKEKEAFLIKLVNEEGLNINSLIERCGLIDLKNLPDDVTFLMFKRGGK